MDCKEAKQKIFEAIDGTLEDRSELDAHLEECASCRAEYRELTEVQEGLAALAEPAVQAPEDEVLADKVMEALGDAPPGDADPLADAAPDVDTSGLKDLRELAALTASSEEAGESMSDMFGLRGQDEAGPSVEVPAIVPPPVLMPMETRPGWFKPAIILGGVLFLAVVALAAVIFLKHGRKSRLEKAGQGPAVAAADHEPTGKEPGETARPGSEPAHAGKAHSRQVSANPLVGLDGAPAARKDDMAANPAGVASNAGDTAARPGTTKPSGFRRSSGGHRNRHSSSHSATRAVRARPSSRSGAGVPDFTTHSQARPAAARGGASNDPLAALLDKKGGSAQARKAPKENLPPNLTTSQIRRVMRKASGAMKRCYELNKQAGLLTVRVTVKGATGRISSISVSGKFRGTPTARCALKAVRRLKFPRFSAPSQKFSFPYLLR